MELSNGCFINGRPVQWVSLGVFHPEIIGVISYFTLQKVNWVRFSKAHLVGQILKVIVDVLFLFNPPNTVGLQVH